MTLKTDAIVKYVIYELNGHEEALIHLPNTQENQFFVKSEKDITVKLDEHTQFVGRLASVHYKQDVIECTLYNSTYETMKRKVTDRDYKSGAAANTILSEICSDAGVTGSTTLTDTLHVYFVKASVYDAAVFLAEVLGKDFWAENGTFYIGDKVGNYPSSSPKELTEFSISRRGIDHREVTCVIIRGFDENRNLITGGAYWNGSQVVEGVPANINAYQVAAFTEQKTSSSTDLNKLAASKLEELRKKSSGVALTVVITDAYDLTTGDYVYLYKPEYELDGTYRIYKITRKPDVCVIEVDKPEVNLETYLEDTKKYEDYGIYVVSYSAPTAPSSLSANTAVVINQDGTTLSYFEVTVGRVEDVKGYIIRYRKQGTTVWKEISVSQPSTGDASAYTDPVEQNATYEFQAATYNEVETLSDWYPSTPYTAVAGKDTTGPSPPTNVVVTSNPLNLKVTWTASTDLDVKEYIIYRGTTSAPTTEYARVSGTMFVDSDVDTGTTYYYRLKAVDYTGNVSSTYSNEDSGSPTGTPPPSFTVPATPSFADTDILPQSYTEEDGTVRVWFEILVHRVSDATGYIISYRESGATEFTHIDVPQFDATEDPKTVLTPFLKLNQSYCFKICAYNEHGECSSWSTEYCKTTAQDTVAPDAPTNLTATGTIGGIVISWDATTPSDWDHFNVYISDTSTPPVNPTFSTKSKVVFYETTDYGTTKYVWVSSVDLYGNESALTGYATATPQKAAPIDLQIEMRPWTADFKMWEDETTYQKIYWAASDGVSDITIKFADGTTKTVNANTTGTSLTADTIYYFYWEDGQSALQYTTDYSLAVGEGKGLIAVVQVGNNTSTPKKRSTILIYNSYSPTIGTGALAANCIIADHIQAGQINTNHITSDTSLAIRASQILLDGTTIFINSWQHSVDGTKIDGGTIYTGTVDTNQLAANAVTADKIEAGAITTEKLDVRAVTPAKTETITANLVKNGNMETDEWITSSDPNDWEGWRVTLGTGSYVETGYSGAHCLKLDYTTGTGDRAVLLSNLFPVRPNNHEGCYLIEYAAKASKTDAKLMLQTYYYDTTKTYVGWNQIANVNCPLPGTKWTKFAYAFIPDGKFTNNYSTTRYSLLRFYVYHSVSETGGSIYLDDVSVKFKPYWWPAHLLLMNSGNGYTDYATDPDVPSVMPSVFWVRKAAYSNSSGHLVYGPYCDLKKGKYTVFFLLKVKNIQSSSSNVCQLEVADAGANIATRQLTPADFPDTTNYFTFALEFEITTDKSGLEFRVWFYTGVADLYVDSIWIVEHAPATPTRLGKISTDQIQFSSLTFDPPYETGKLWYRSDKDELRFAAGTTTDKVSFIPRIPINYTKTPQENYLRNADFTDDVDEDGVPDYWEEVQQNGSITLDTGWQHAGDKALKCTVNGTGTTDYAGVMSDYIPVTPNTEYYCSMAVKHGTAGSGTFGFIVYWYYGSKGSSFANSTAISKQYGDTSVHTPSGTVTSPADARWARVLVQLRTPNVAGHYGLIDNVIFSRIRAAAPTAGVVAAASGGGGVVPIYLTANSTWFESSDSYDIGVPSEDHEVLFVHVTVHSAGWSVSGTRLLIGRIENVTKSEYYPSQNYYECPYCYVYSANGTGDFFFTIPKNVKGDQLKFNVMQWDGPYSSTNDVLYFVISVWGHDQHYHR